MSTILLTGATGYIGSHTWIALREAGFKVQGVDNFANSSPAVLDRLTTLLGERPAFEEADVNDTARIAHIIARNEVKAVIHFAAHKAVGESIEKPLEYYSNNLTGLISVATAMKSQGVKTLVFSSSATVYGMPERLPIDEECPLSSTNPYGITKLIGEQLLRELERCNPGWAIAYLRYFNPVGAHPSGLIGEDPRGVPNNLMPYLSQVATGKRAVLQIFGGDYDTPDGTGVRDYIHVLDLASGHVAALRFLLNEGKSLTVNLGTGQGYSVLDVVKAFEKTTGRTVPYRIVDRRPGDVASCYADPTKAARLLGWKAHFGLEHMCTDTWRWQSMNPEGFQPPRAETLFPEQTKAESERIAPSTAQVEMKRRLKIVVGIATAGRREQMRFTLMQLARQRRMPDGIVVCPASPEDFDDADAVRVGCPVSRVHGGRGLTAQRNVIMGASAGADVLLFLDDDFYPAVDYIEQVEALFAAEDDVVLATGHPKHDGASGPGIDHEEAVLVIDAMAEARPERTEEVFPTYGGYGCNMSIRMAPVDAHRLRFDENLPLYGWLEDIEFSRRLAQHGRVIASPALRGVHLGTKKGRASGLRLGYSQVANPVYMVRKGTVDAQYVYRHVIKNIAKNSVRAFFPEPWVDRRGRLKGNLIALRDLWTGRLDPRKIVRLQ